jgi:hypothetical protein
MTDIPADPTFLDKFVSQTGPFCAALLEAIPELEGVTVIPSWRIPQQHAPAGLARWRREGSPSLSELMNMLLAQHNATEQLQALTVQHLGKFDEHAVKLAEEIRAKTGEIERLDRALADRQAALAAIQHPGGVEPAGDAHSAGSHGLGSVPGR